MQEAAQTRRERLRDATCDEIKTTARQQMAEEGTAAISLRSIARRMGVTAPALYRYFADRDALITALIADAYIDLADTLEQARDNVPAEDHARRIYDTGLAYRRWALEHPTDYILIFGNPIPGFDAPMEATLPAARRSLNVFIDLLQAAWQSGAATPPAEYIDLLPQFQERIIGGPEFFAHDMPHPAIELSMVMWGRWHGMISLELFNHAQPLIAGAGELYRFELIALLQRMGMTINN
jgi:AcrR family transcriptional regulator